MSKYILLIVGCVVIENLTDIILPAGKLNGFIKNVIGVFIFAILLLPILELVKNI